jgi:uncharacterized SAM-binding protein YcdF (DUF218 family)
MVDSLATPMVWVLALLSLGLFLSRWRRRTVHPGVGWYLILAGTLILLVLGTRSVANTLSYSLESRYIPPMPETIRNLDIVVVPGAGARSAHGLRREAEPTGPSYSRLCNGVRVFQQSNARVLVFCGGPPEDAEAEVMRTLAVTMGVRQDEILAETESTNTMENAACLAKLLPPGENRRIGLVTSATHMRRAEGAFKKQFPGDIILPIPVDYMYDPFVWTLDRFIPSASALEESTVALHEWAGIVWYSLRYD